MMIPISDIFQTHFHELFSIFPRFSDIFAILLWFLSTEGHFFTFLTIKRTSKWFYFFQFHTISVFFSFWCSFFRWKRRIFVVFSGKYKENHCFLSLTEPQNQFEFNYEILQINPDFNILQPRIIGFLKLWPVLAGQGGGQRS